MNWPSAINWAPPRLCIFCNKVEGDPTPWCSGSPGAGCTYGLGHEFPIAAATPQHVKVRDPKLCTKCGLHPRNPASTTNGCEHTYEGAK